MYSESSSKDISCNHVYRTLHQLHKWHKTLQDETKNQHKKTLYGRILLKTSTGYILPSTSNLHFNFWHSGTLALSPERQSARMSEIKNVR